jgi:hypothetical protein
MATLHRPALSMATSVTSTIIAPLPEPEYQPQQENTTRGDVHQDQYVALEKPSPTPSPTPEIEADPNIVTWDSPDDPANPRNWSVKYRWFLTLLISVANLCGYVQIFPFSTQQSTYHSRQDILVIITGRCYAIDCTRISLVERAFLLCHNCIPPRVCAGADILGARFGNVREESDTRPGVRGVHTIPPGPEPREKYGDAPRDALSMRILRMRVIEQLRWNLGRLVGCRETRACRHSAIHFYLSWPCTRTHCGWLVRSFVLIYLLRCAHLTVVSPVLLPAMRVGDGSSG